MIATTFHARMEALCTTRSFPIVFCFGIVPMRLIVIETESKTLCVPRLQPQKAFGHVDLLGASLAH